MVKRAVSAIFVGLLLTMGVQAAFVHPGCLSTQEDLDRMAAKVAASAQPWKGSWDILVGNTNGFLDDTPYAAPTIYVSSSEAGDNYWRLYWDAAKSYQCALRYRISGETAYANKAVEIMNAWASTHTAWSGNHNIALRAGLYGYQFACAGELLRDYSGWAPADFAAFQTYLLEQFYAINYGFLNGHTGCTTYFWANWDHANLAAILAIGVFTDRQDIFDYGVDYFYNGSGNANINNAIHYVFPNGLAQFQESGRDQGHASIGVPLLGTICEIAWNQGLDFFGANDNAFLSTCEYLSKYNLWYDVPYVTYTDCDYWLMTNIGSGGRGSLRAGYDLVYNHYVNRMGMAAPYTAMAAAKIRPEGGGGNYGTTSGGFDQIGFTTLTHSLDPIVGGGVPDFLRPHVKGAIVTLSWRGTPYAQSYNVKRSTTSGGPYGLLATVGAKNTYYTDGCLEPGTTYYYVVSANNPGGESANSVEMPVANDGQLYGTIIGTEGSYNNGGLRKECAFDGALLRNYFSGPASVSWAGLDLGQGVSAVITGVKYCPRTGYGSRMVGGKFQGSNTADFSSSVVDLYTISTAPSDGVLTPQSISSGSSFRYVRYISAEGGYGNVAEVQFLGNVTGLAAPAAPDASVNVYNGYNFQLSWNYVPGVVGYKIRRAAAPGGPYIVLEDQAGTGYQETGLPANSTYYYIVSAYNGAGETESSEMSASTQTSPTLVAHLKMNGNVADSSGNNYLAGTTGDPNFVTGYLAQAIELDGADDYVSLPYGVANSQDITIATWVNWDGGNMWQRIFDFGTGTNQYLFLTPSSGTGKLRFAITTSSGAGEQFVETTQLSTGVWVHVAVTLGGNTARLYVNGVLRATNAGVTINPSDFNPGANYIGDSQWSADPLFNGRIDDFRIYDYALSASAVAALASMPMDTTPPAAPANLIATAGEASVSLDWADNMETDLSSYTVYRSTVSGGPYNVIASGLVSSDFIDGPVSNGAYYYVVTATDTADNESANSNEAFAGLFDQTAPAAPMGLTATAGIERVSLDWQDNTESDFAGYSVYRSTISGAHYGLVVSGLTASHYVDTAAFGGRTYYYVVTAVDTSGNESAYSNQVVAASGAGRPIAGWRFEEGPNGGYVPGTSNWTVYRIGTPDVSGNGNHLCNYFNAGDASSIRYSNATAPNYPRQNSYCGLSSGTYPCMATWSAKSTPAGTDLESAVLADWTIEALVNPTAISGSNRAIVGRDGYVNGPFAPLYFQILSSGNLRGQYYDQGGVMHEVVDPATMSTNNWYYVAVVCDTTTMTLTLYKTDLTGGQTTPLQVAQTNLTGSPDYDLGPWPDGANKYWSVFRGYYNRQHVDRFVGYIDEVRISGAVLDVYTEGLLSAGNSAPPSFTVKPINNLLAIEGTEYSGNSLAAYAQDPDGLETVTFSKEAGPEWLLVAEDGNLSGAPNDPDVGENTFTVRAADSSGFFDTTLMTIEVANIYSGVQGINDLLGLASQWLSLDCVDTPACGGADLDGDASVTLSDVAILASHWVTE